MLAEGEIRGHDASGYAFVGPNGDGMYKKDVPGSKLHVGKIPADASAIILHTRNGTHGSPTDNENNHPVVSPSGNIRLVHNGIIYNHDSLRLMLGKVGKGLPDVDSSVIPAMIEEFGLESTSEISGYAACAWFDRETDDTIHLARFSGSGAPVSIAYLWDGSYVFASTDAILGRALTRAGVEWYGLYPKPFETLEEGDYLQLLGGEVIAQSTVEWKSNYHYSGPDYSRVTSGQTKGFGSTPVSTGSSLNQPHTSLATTSRAQGDDYDEFEHDVPLALTEPDRWPTDEPEDRQDDAMRRIVSKMFSEDGGEDDLTDDEYENWMTHGTIHGRELVVDDDADDESIMAEVVGEIRPMFYTKGHDGDYQDFTTMKGLVTSLAWQAGLTGGENVLAGPDEGLLRWINQIGDVGSIDGDGTETSWVADDGIFRTDAAFSPEWLREGVVNLRKLVGA